MYKHRKKKGYTDIECLGLVPLFIHNRIKSGTILFGNVYFIKVAYKFNKERYIEISTDDKISIVSVEELQDMYIEFCKNNGS